METCGPQLVAVLVILAGTILGRRALAFRAEGRQPLRAGGSPRCRWWDSSRRSTSARILQDGQVGWLTTLEPVVLIGVGLQLPCGLLAVWLVRTLLRAAERLGCTLARRGLHGPRPPERLAASASPSLRLSALASRHAGRAPPFPA